MIPETIQDLKRAETLAETLDDELLRNKIYELLAYCNYKNNNYPLILKYSQKLLDSSKRMNAVCNHSYGDINIGFLLFRTRGGVMAIVTRCAIISKCV
jgi:hypothetical protein